MAKHLRKRTGYWNAEGESLTQESPELQAHKPRSFSLCSSSMLSTCNRVDRFGAGGALRSASMVPRSCRVFTVAPSGYADAGGTENELCAQPTFPFVCDGVGCAET
eukprot:CAMPEP_0205863098 /NCGR_PEP_ID=MMETSP1083-20121108/6645_1 /ASSEMBLY_ACC=CAM_ASM_000430 /TAXON_ID=97485 /ORGANISM="Prymnesium parvum, Strain Texoma1" /LENGTH=105 /DNA_ID=CAMNT_0053224893 /DNA_START=130 /DNA_END=443 /DNA_ORIENTATION=+